MVSTNKALTLCFYLEVKSLNSHLGIFEEDCISTNSLGLCRWTWLAFFLSLVDNNAETQPLLQYLSYFQKQVMSPSTFTTSSLMNAPQRKDNSTHSQCPQSQRGCQILVKYNYTYLPYSPSFQIFYQHLLNIQ